MEHYKMTSIDQLRTWFEENKAKFDLSITKTECYKWTRWQKDNSIHVFPCVCPTRNKECIFIEIYFKTQKAYGLILKEQEYADALEQYYQIKHNRNAVFEWVKYYEQLGKEIVLFKSEIKVHTQMEPYKTISIYLPKEEFPKLLEFQNIFTEYYYSEEYENY